MQCEREWSQILALHTDERIAIKIEPANESVTNSTYAQLSGKRAERCQRQLEATGTLRQHAVRVRGQSRVRALHRLEWCGHKARHDREIALHDEMQHGG